MFYQRCLAEETRISFQRTLPNVSPFALCPKCTYLALWILLLLATSVLGFLSYEDATSFNYLMLICLRTNISSLFVPVARPCRLHAVTVTPQERPSPHETSIIAPCPIAPPSRKYTPLPLACFNCLYPRLFGPKACSACSRCSIDGIGHMLRRG
jgi:hypothetical protein